MYTNVSTYKKEINIHIYIYTCISINKYIYIHMYRSEPWNRLRATLNLKSSSVLRIACAWMGSGLAKFSWRPTIRVLFQAGVGPHQAFLSFRLRRSLSKQGFKVLIREQTRKNPLSEQAQLHLSRLKRPGHNSPKPNPQNLKTQLGLSNR